MHRRLITAALLIAALTGLSACGSDTATKDAKTEGIYLDVAGLKYQVQISRVLNPYDVEDREYFYGLPPATAQLDKGEQWFGVFMRVQNTSSSKQFRSASKFEIEDTTGAKFAPIPMSARVNAHAYTQNVLAPNTIFPQLDTTAGSSTTQGALLLFKLPTKRMENRPLQLHIFAPTGTERASVDLDV